MASLADAALEYALNGTLVFPLQPLEKRPLASAAPNGFKDATSDPETVERWWSSYPEANIGITGIDAIDVDVAKSPNQKSGFEAFNRLKNAGLLAGASRVVVTPSGGLHLYYAPTDQPNAAGIGGYALDFRGAHHGYIVGPPSVLPNGVYKLNSVTADPPKTLNLMRVREYLDPPPPQLMVPRRPVTVRDKKELGGSLAAWVSKITAADSGVHSKIVWAFCRAVETGLDESAISDIRDAAIQTLKTCRPERPAEKEADDALSWARKAAR